MIKEAIESVAKAALENQEPRFFHREGDPAHVGYKRVRGDFERVELEPQPRRIECTRLEDLVRWAKNPPLDLHSTVAEGHAAVLIGEERVSLVFDMRNRRERAELNLVRSDEAGFFIDLADDEDGLITVAALWEALRYRLTECKARDGLVDQVRKLATKSDGAALVEKGRMAESLGKSVTTRVANETDMPAESQRFFVRPYANADLDFREWLDCILDPEVNSMRWILRPIASSWLNLWQAAADMIESRLMKELSGLNIPLVRGSV